MLLLSADSIETIRRTHSRYYAAQLEDLVNASLADSGSDVGVPQLILGFARASGLK